MRWSLMALAICSLLFGVNALFEFTNIKCEAVDKAYNSIKYCHIKAVNRTYKYVSAANHFHSTQPITNVSVGISFLKKANGYKPFLYNFTVDGCKFLNGGGNVVQRFIYKLFRDYSNITHPCPYQHDIAVDRLPASHLQNVFSKVLPVPTGDYLVVSNWYTYNVLRTIVKVFASLS